MPWNKDGTRKKSAFYLKSGNNLGNTKIMQPGKSYKFKGSTVLEVPLANR